MAAVATRPKYDAKKLAAIRQRNVQVYQDHGKDIGKGVFLHVTADVFAEQKFLLDVIDQLAGDAPAESD